MDNFNFLNFTKYQYKRFLNNFFSFFSIFSTQTIAQILYPPAMIYAWGVENFGVWIFIISIPSTLAIFNINLSTASRSEMSINHEKNNLFEVNKIFQNALSLVVLNLIIFTIVWITIISFQEMSLKIFDKYDYQTIRLIFLIIIFSTYFTILDQIFFCGITFNGKVSTYNYIILLFDVSTKIFIPCSGLLFDSLIYPAIVYFILSAVKTIILFYFYNKNKSIISLSLKLFNFKYSLKLFKLSLSYYFDNIVGIIKNNGVIILFGLFFSPIIVGLVSTTRTLFYFLPMRFLDVFNNTMFYEYSKIFGKKNIVSLKKALKLQMLLSILILIVFVFISLLIGKEIYNFWTNGKYNLTFSLLLLIVADAVIFNLFNSLETLIKSVNKFFKSTMIKILFSLITIMLSYIFFVKGYSYIYYFGINLLSSIIILISVCFITLKFYYKLK